MKTEKVIKFSDVEKNAISKCNIVTKSIVLDKKRQRIEEDDSKIIDMIARDNVTISKSKLVKALQIIEKNISRFSELSSYDYWDKATEEAKGFIAPSKGNHNPRQDLIQSKIKEAKFFISELETAKLILLSAVNEIIN